AIYRLRSGGGGSAAFHRTRSSNSSCTQYIMYVMIASQMSRGHQVFLSEILDVDGVMVYAGDSVTGIDMKVLRVRLGVTQRQLAVVLGVSTSQLANSERGFPRGENRGPVVTPRAIKLACEMLLIKYTRGEPIQ